MYKTFAEFLAPRQSALRLGNEALARQVGRKRLVVTRWRGGAFVPHDSIHHLLAAALHASEQQIADLCAGQPTDVADLPAAPSAVA